MNFYSYGKHTFKSFDCTKTRKDSKGTKMSRNEVMPPAISNNNSQPVFPYHVHNQADFDNPFTNGRALFIYLFIFIYFFKYLQEFKLSYQ